MRVLRPFLPSSVNCTARTSTADTFLCDMHQAHARFLFILESFICSVGCPAGHRSGRRPHGLLEHSFGKQAWALRRHRGLKLGGLFACHRLGHCFRRPRRRPRDGFRGCHRRLEGLFGAGLERGLRGARVRAAIGAVCQAHEQRQQQRPRRHRQQQHCLHGGLHHARRHRSGGFRFRGGGGSHGSGGLVLCGLDEGVELR
mmetsp:Transcript_13532/g.22917  ORF Transcript_13532/g.22917 Transcript_13532/m.22917 type:complete len:200 (-) Transcript_13532:673-1272(-)